MSERMKINWHVYFGAFCLLLIGIQTSLAQVKQGVLILASAEGQISFQDASGNPAKKVNPGEPIPPEHFLITGRGAKVIGLLSNGTLMTIGENTRMRVATFEQEPFEDKGEKISDLPTEPSKSKVILDLDTGSLILKTKKLNKDSTLKINSPLGFAGIRGTEFQMASNPGQGVQLDVTESTVEFTPPGGGPPIAVSEGSGLSAPPGVAPTLRPVNPTVARKIEVSNQAATDATQDVSLEQVSTAMEQVAVEDETDTTDNSSPSAEEEDASEAESDSELEEADSAEAEEQEMVEAEEANEFEEDAQSGEQDGSDSQGDAGEQENQGSESFENPENSNTEQSGGDTQQDSGFGNNENKPGKQTAPKDSTKQGSETIKAGRVARNASAESGVSLENAVLENNAEIAQARKTGKISKESKALAQFGLVEEQTLRFYELSPLARAALLKEDRAVVRRLLALDGFSPQRADAFFEYRRNTRFLILELEDEVMLTLLDQGIEEMLLEESLTKLNLDFSKSNRVPNPSQFSGIDERAKSLSESLMQSENGEVMEKLGEMANGEWTDELLRIGEVADSLMRDYQIDENLLIETLDVSEVMSNPFYAEVSALYEQLQLDGLIQGGGQVIGGRHLIVTGNARILANNFSNKPGDLVISASHSLSLPEDLEWNPTTTTNSRLVAMSAGDITLNQGVSFKSATSDLVLAARNNLLLRQVSLDAAREVAVRGLRDVSLNDVSIGADFLATIKARRDLDVDGLIFKRNVSQILMEATTMRLRNVDFPLASQVRLNSLHGPIDGKYPNFGTSIPAANQIGRVNFIENVRSGGNLMNDRPSFDLHGNNIEIGTIARP